MYSLGMYCEMLGDINVPYFGEGMMSKTCKRHKYKR